MLQLQYYIHKFGLRIAVLLGDCNTYNMSHMRDNFVVHTSS